MISLGDDNAVRGYQQIIDTYREAKQWQQATAVAKEATQKLPNDRGLQMVYAAQLADTGAPDKALAEVQSMLKGKGDDRDVYITLAQMKTRLRRWGGAQHARDKAEQLSTKPDDTASGEGLASCGYHGTSHSTTRMASASPRAGSTPEACV